MTAVYGRAVKPIAVFGTLVGYAIDGDGILGKKGYGQLTWYGLVSYLVWFGNRPGFGLVN